MPVSTKTVSINDTEFQIAQFTATRGLKYFKLITQLVAPSFSELQIAQESGEGLTKAVTLLVENMDKVGFETLVKDLLSQTTKEGKEIMFDLEFAGAYDTLFELIMEVVKFNFGSVFTGKGGLGKTLLNQM